MCLVRLLSIIIKICVINEAVCGLKPPSDKGFFWKTIFRKNTASSYGKEVEEDAKLSTDQLILKHKYPAEVHHVVTEDGYILTVHRIPKPGHQPVLLVHGLLASSASFVMLGPHGSLAFLLHSENYDVWLANTRGNVYSKNHTTLSTDDPEFWKFSFHEVGIFDLPATIDYVRRRTSFHEIIYIGHSQGATAFFVLCSMKPEYNDKIMLMQAMAPVVYFRSTKIKRESVRKLRAFLKSKTKSNHLEIWPQGELKSICLSDPQTRDDCFELARTFIGGDFERYNKSLDPLILSNLPAGGSAQQLLHYLQVNKSGDFCSFDYGYDGNFQAYGRLEPELYNLSAITVPVLLHYGQSDYVASPKDVHKLHKLLDSLVGLHAVASAEFNHFDFVWSPQAFGLLYKKILSLMQSFVNGTLHYAIE